MKRQIAFLLVLALLFTFTSAFAQSLSLGAQGDNVAKLQEKLIDVGLLSGEADGIYGKGTQIAVKSFQSWLKDKGYEVDVDGIAGPATLKYLSDPSIQEDIVTLEPGEHGDAVARLQSKLYDLCLLSEMPDGAFGSNTQSAVAIFQQSLADHGVTGIRTDGTADRATRKYIFSDLSKYGIATPASYDSDNPLSLRPENLYAHACVLMDADTGEILFEKQADAKMYPASTTKTMTLLIALEKLKLKKVVTIPQEANQIPGDSSRVPVHPGEKMTVKDLLVGLMLRSGNDAANAVAVLAGGSLDKFADAMNDKAQALGMTGTHYVNPHGYHDDAHYTTARDMAVLAREALKNESFVKIVSTLHYTMAATDQREALPLSTSYSILNSSSKYYDERAFGIKTGYTSKAGYCYVGAAHNDGRTLIAVIMKCGMDKEYKWLDVKRLYDYGFALYP